MASERSEVLMRIIVLVISGVILVVWKGLIQIIVVFHFIYALFSGKRDRDVAEFCEYWNRFVYSYLRYMTFNTNKRPFPFRPLGRNREGFEF
jgi:hypothetical protein